MNDTKQKILDAAERLIAEQGYAATSLRQIIGEAGVNLAAIHYHFGSKEELLHELVLRKAAPVNEKRLAELDRYRKECPEGVPPVRKILTAFLMPMAEGAERHPQFVRVMGRVLTEGLMPVVVERNFKPVVDRFVQALREALPALSDEELQWRIHFMTGAMALTMCGLPPGGFEARIERLLVFLTAGFEAPPSARSGNGGKVECGG